MNARTVAAAISAFLCFSAIADSTEYFVDRNRPDDSGDGKSEATAFRTIKYAIDKASAGDIITVLPGEYGDDQGDPVTSYGHNTRVVVGKNVTLRSRDGAATTQVVGKWATSGNGMGADGVRCISASNACKVVGFTFRDGASNFANSGNDQEANRGGGAFINDGAAAVFTDCVFTNCVGTRGGAAYQGKYVRCRFVGNYGTAYGAAARNISAFSCLFTQNKAVSGYSVDMGVVAYPRAIVNCTIVNNGLAAIAQATTRNSSCIANTIVLHNTMTGSGINADATSGSKIWKYCVTDNSNVATHGDSCLQATDGRGEMYSPASGDYRLGPDACSAGIGSLELAGQYFKDYIEGDDIAGHAFCADGKTVSAGAFQEQVTDDAACLVVDARPDNGTFTVNGLPVFGKVEYRSGLWPEIVHVAFTPVSGKGLIGFSRSDTNGVDWPLESDDVYMLMPRAGTCETTQRIGDVVYVDAGNKDDASADGSDLKPYWEINQATTNQARNLVVMVADGHYRSGGFYADSITNMVYVTSSYWTRIRSVNGANHTFIHGAASGDEDSTEGCGDGATRCAWLGSFTQLQGFTLLDGHSGHSASDLTKSRGGAVYAAQFDAKVGVTDCVISNCVGSRGAVVSGGVLERCLITKNYSINNGLTRNCILASCLVTGNAEHPQYAGTGIIGYQTKVYSCTIADNTSTIGAVLYNNSAPTPVVSSIVTDMSGCQYDIDADHPYCTNCVIGSIDSSDLSHVHGCVYGDPLYVDKSAGDYRVRVDSPAAYHGDPECLYRATDYTGKPFFLGANGSFTVGAFTEKLGGITAACTNVTSGISPSGWQAAPTAGSYTFEATATDERGLLGFEVNGEFVEDDGTGTITLDYDPATANGDAAWLRVVAVYDAAIYVDERNGDDSNTGVSPGAAKKTLAAGAALLRAGDTLRVAPGVYTNNTMLQTYTSSPLGTYTPIVRSRLVIPEGCSVIATGAAEETFIVGAPDTTSTGDANCLGENAIRCVFMNANTRLVGFTITGGHTKTGSETEATGNMNVCGGGIGGYSETSVVEDCIISNNVATRGAGIRYGTCRRCRFYDNRSTSNCSAMRNVKAYQCIMDKNKGEPVFADSVLNSCTVGAGNTDASGTKAATTVSWNTIHETKALNTLFAGVGAINMEWMTNCAYRSSVSVTVSGDNIAPAVGDPNLDAQGRPQKGSVAIDAGDMSLLEEEDADTDLAGSQRIYNNALDIGCHEYDARGDFALALKPNGGVEVMAASPAVEQVAGGVLVRDGKMDATWTRSSTRGSFLFDCEVTGGGTLTVWLNGDVMAELTSDSGAQTFNLRNALTENAFSFRYAPSDGDTGGALVSNMALQKGFSLHVR